MPRIFAYLIVLCCICAASGARAQSTGDFGMTFANRFALPPNPDTMKRPAISVHYARSPYRSLDFYRPKGVVVAPLLVLIDDAYLSDAGRSFGMVLFLQKLIDDGFAVAIVAVDPPELKGMRFSTSQIGVALGFLRGDQKRFGALGAFAIAGIGSGAGIAALAGCDPAVLGAADGAFEKPRAVMLLNPLLLDGERAVREAPERIRKPYVRAFGETPEVQRDASAIGHLDPPNTLSFYILDEQRRGMRIFGEAFAATLRSKAVPSLMPRWRNRRRKPQQSISAHLPIPQAWQR